MSPQELQPPPRGRPPLEAGGQEAARADWRPEEQVAGWSLTGDLPAVIQAQAEPLSLLRAGEHQVRHVLPLQPQHAALLLHLNSRDQGYRIYSWNLDIFCHC